MKIRMIKAGFAALAVLSVVLFAAASSSAEKMPDGKSIFVAASCNTCHSVTAQGIQRSGTATGGQAPPDLSGTGLRHGADWFKQWLLKTVALNGKKHIKKWKGSDADLATLCGWLAGLKRR